MQLDSVDKAIIRCTQSGLPLSSRPYLDIADQLEISESEVMQRLQVMQKQKILRRIAAVPNHYKLGYTANGMSVWNIPDEKILHYGNQVGRLPFVSHCYHRPRHPGIWEYNLFAMIHAHSRDEVSRLAGQIAELLGDDSLGYDILYSKRILKKTGLRI